jgi:hypothetical protein
MTTVSAKVPCLNMRSGQAIVGRAVPTIVWSSEASGMVSMSAPKSV